MGSFRSYTVDSDGPASEHYRLDGAEIDGQRFDGTVDLDIKHFTSSGMEWCLAEVLERFDTDPHKQRLLGALVEGVPLHGADRLEEWRARAAAYPDELARRVVPDYLAAGLRFNPAVFAERADLLAPAQHLCWIAQAVIGMLAGLNRRYHPGSQYLGAQRHLPPIKWADRFLASLRFTPPQTPERLTATLRTAPAEGWRLMQGLLDETLDLIELHLPRAAAPFPDDRHPKLTLAAARHRFLATPHTLLGRIGEAHPLGPQTR